MLIVKALFLRPVTLRNELEPKEIATRSLEAPSKHRQNNNTLNKLFLITRMAINLISCLAGYLASFCSLSCSGFSAC